MMRHAIQKLAEIGLNYDEIPLPGFHEPFFNGMVHKAKQGIVKPFHVQQGARLGMKPKLRPRDDFKKFLEGTDASGQCDESIGEFCHESLAFVHGFHDAQIRQAAMANFLRHQRLGDHANHMSAAREHSIGDHAHQADIAPTVNKIDASLREFASNVPCGFCVNGIRSVAGAAEDAKAFE
jgi:hypothetical protein